MKSRLTTSFVGIASVAVSLSLAACGGDKKDEGAPAPEAGTGSTAGDGSAQAGTMGTAGTGAAGTGVNPRDINGNGMVDRDDVVPAPPDVLEMLDPEVDWESLIIVYPSMYSAYDGKHTFQVPAHVDGTALKVGDWQAIPADAVAFDTDPDVDGGVLITILKPAGKVTIAASSGKVGGTAPLYITEGTPEQWDIGEARYNNGVEYDLPMLDFATLILDPNWTPPKPPEDLACNNCHTTGAKYFEIQHTPTQTARYSDDDLRVILSQGMKPTGVGFRVLPSMLGAKSDKELYSEFHTWDSTPDEQTGLIIYLRSLTPQGQGDIRLPDGTYVPAGTEPPTPAP